MADVRQMRLRFSKFYESPLFDNSSCRLNRSTQHRR